MLDNLLRQTPEIGRNFGSAVTQFVKALDYDFALEAWSKGDGKSARAHLQSNLTNRKFFLTYLLTFVSSFLYFEKTKSRLNQMLLRFKRARSGKRPRCCSGPEKTL
jgi:hypothetical protein